MAHIAPYIPSTITKALFHACQFPPLEPHRTAGFNYQSGSAARNGLTGGSLVFLEEIVCFFDANISIEEETDQIMAFRHYSRSKKIFDQLADIKQTIG